ncbi:hypothetical protein SAMN02787118_11570 [Streptomyces mirabilis]|uniref:Calcineurin-like phosphoesterase n=1 Tax=Streptomyces mirabilis TaxID=68239 RepID=A0A1I2NUP2_9ACTN|nr:hypothetical protein SAMN02787118_11570 [Streptomyces mirabilis]
MERRPEVVGLITGHAHTPAATAFAGRPLVVGPGVTWTLRLPREGEGTADRDAPPGFAFHVLADDGRLTGHFRTAWPTRRRQVTMPGTVDSCWWLPFAWRTSSVTVAPGSAVETARARSAAEPSRAPAKAIRVSPRTRPAV